MDNQEMKTATPEAEEGSQAAPSERVDDVDKAWEAAQAEKSARDLGREAGIKPEEKEMFDAIAERRGDARLKELEGMDGRGDKLQGELAEQKELLLNLQRALDEVREELGLKKPEQEHPSVTRSQDRLLQLMSEQEEAARDREAFLQRFEAVIKEELRDQAIQEKMNKVFEKLEATPREEIDSLAATGKTRDGKPLEAEGMETLEPETMKRMVEAFKLGLKELPKIIERLPDFLNKLDDRFKEEVNAEAQEIFGKLVAKSEQKVESAPVSPKSTEEKPAQAENGLAEGERGANRVGFEEAVEAAYAEKPLRDFAREADVTAEEKARIDSIAERRGDEALENFTPSESAANSEGNQSGASGASAEPA